MMLNSLTLLDESILSSGFCLGGVCSAEGGGINVVQGEKRRDRRSRVKERNAEKGTAGGGEHFCYCFFFFLYLLNFPGRWGRWRVGGGFEMVNLVETHNTIVLPEACQEYLKLIPILLYGICMYQPHHDSNDNVGNLELFFLFNRPQILLLCTRYQFLHIHVK